MNSKNWIVPYLRKYRGLFVLAIVLGALTILFGSGLMFTSGYLISKASLRPESILLIYVPIVGVRTFGIGRSALNYAAKLTGHQFVLKILADMRVRLYRILEPQALFLRSRFQMGDLLGVLADDIEHLQNFYLRTLIPSLISVLIYTIIVICAGIFSLSFAIMLFFLIGLLILVGPIVSYLYTKAKNEQLKAGRHRLYQQFTDGMLGISDWIFSGRYLNFMQKYLVQEDQQLQLEKKAHTFRNWRDFGNQILLGAIVVLTIHWVDGQTIDGSIQPVFIAAVGLVMLSLLESFLPIADAVSDITNYQDSLKRLEQVQADEGQPQPEGPGISCTINTFQPAIEIHHLCFSYKPEQPLLDDFSLKLRQGEKIAILGRSGAGKTTFLNLLMGAITPHSGSVLLNGVNVTELAPIVPKLMAVLNQKPYLFNTSVMNNIRLGNSDATDEEVFEAVRKVQLHELLASLPNGYETNMQEAGQRFSGGEQQRIALARILLQNTPIVIMDEPTVGLDPVTETRLLETIFETLKEKTLIWVTHHLTGVEKVDRILFLEDGKIMMDGNHQQLMNREERYRHLYKLDRPFFL